MTSAACVSNACDHAAPADALRPMLVDVVQSFGFDGAVYMHLGHRLQGAGEPTLRMQPLRIAATRGFDTAHYLRRNYLALDPLAARAYGSYVPFSWTLVELEDADADRRLWLGVMSGWGVRRGVVAPVQDYALGPALLNLFSTSETSGERSADDHGRLLMAVATVHTTALALMPSAVDLSETSLSPREIAVLRLAAIGRTEQETALALALSRRGVQFHLARAMEKLAAPNKTAAVAVALSAGLIRL